MPDTLAKHRDIEQKKFGVHLDVYPHSIPPKPRIYYKGALRLAFITRPTWRAENEVETRATIW